MVRTILIADNDASLSLSIRRTLEEQNYDVGIAKSSNEVKYRIKTEQIDLLILGDTLSGQGWITVLRWVRHNASTTSIPIIVLASDMDEADAYEAWHESVDSFQSKKDSALPILTSELVVKIKRIFMSLEEDKITPSS